MPSSMYNLFLAALGNAEIVTEAVDSSFYHITLARLMFIFYLFIGACVRQLCSQLVTMHDNSGWKKVRSFCSLTHSSVHDQVAWFYSTCSLR